jgi:hypothetical protein
MRMEGRRAGWTDRQTDRHGEADSCFSKFFERHQKQLLFYPRFNVEVTERVVISVCIYMRLQIVISYCFIYDVIL